jgi:hypothetical protein
MSSSAVQWRRWRITLVTAVVAAWCAAGTFAQVSERKPAADTLSSRLSDQEYWRLIEEFSEPNGYFQSDNLVSNERPFQTVVPALRLLKKGGAYLGVAPDQNFTYIIALEPKIAFITDIRRGNLLEQLMYKAVIELSADRAEFLSRLFSKKRPEGLGPQSTAVQLFDAFDRVLTSEELYNQNFQAISDHLTKKHGFALSADDLNLLGRIYFNFYWFGPAITYDSSSGGRGSNRPSYEELQTATDLDGRNRAYLATEENFKILKTFEEKNLLVPVVGDFAGTKALRSVGKYLADHGATVSAWYVSNVEQYLFQNSVWQAYYANVAMMPLDDDTVFIRSASQNTVLDPIKALLKDVGEGRIRVYRDITVRGSIR